jgi:hypothetical protein
MNPELHMTPQLVPLQVAMPSGGLAHAMHEVGPQLATLALETQAPLQLW